MQIRSMATARLALSLSLTTVLGACAFPMPPEHSAEQGAESKAGPAQSGSNNEAATKASTVLLDPSLQQYLIVQGEQIGLVNVADDGTYTFFGFREAPVGLQLFDSDGRQLATSSSGNVLGVQGLYKGVLLKKGAANSFATPNPRAKGDPKPKLDGDSQIAAIVRELDAQTIAMPAFRRTLDLVNNNSPERAQSAAVNAAPTSSESTSTASSMATASRLAALRTTDQAKTVVETPEGRIYRVFFASAGRAVVSPDDGLSRIEDEANRASFIRITGFADSAGSADLNVALARNRAEAIRGYLVRRGVEPSKIGVSWDGTGGYLGDNTTAAGRALNRRAEILIQTARSSQLGNLGSAR